MELLYIYKGIDLQELGVNAIFVHSGSITQEMIQRAHQGGLKIYAEFATLNGKNYVEKYPEAWAINEKGEKVDAASWFMGVCPTEPGFKKYRMNQLEKLLQKFDLDGIWMDYVHWHAQFEEPEPILPETCFCDNCLTAFSNSTGLQIPDGPTPLKADWILTKHDIAWRDWRCSVISDWTKEIRSILKKENPEALLGIYHCPWTDDEFDGARRRVLGLDYDLLKEIVDVFSPMVYHGRMGRSPEWVKENINWFCNRLLPENETTPKIWPIVQAYNDPYTISNEEFGKILRYGLSGCSSGAMMFTSTAIVEDPEKIKMMSNIYLE